jgi:hypothetical protein
VLEAVSARVRQRNRGDFPAKFPRIIHFVAWEAAHLTWVEPQYRQHVAIPASRRLRPLLHVEFLLGHKPCPVNRIRRRHFRYRIQVKLVSAVS